MNGLMLLVAMCVGQCECVPAYATPVIVVREPVVYFNVGEVERSRFYDDVNYPKSGAYIRVPIINGYVPSITKGSFSEGSPYIVYDYKAKIPYESVLTMERQRQKDRQERERHLQRQREQEQPPPMIPLRPVPQTPPEPSPAPRPTKVEPVPQISPLPVPQISPLPVIEKEPEGPKMSAPSLSTGREPLRRPSEVGMPERIITPGYDRQD